VNPSVTALDRQAEGPPVRPIAYATPDIGHARAADGVLRMYSRTPLRTL
jgi:hypothetical protein